MSSKQNPTRREFEKQLDVARHHGLVDCKAMVNANGNTTTLELTWTLANALRLRNRPGVTPDRIIR